MIFTGALIIVLLVGLIITFVFSKRVEQISHHIIEGSHQMERSKYGYRIEQSSYAHYAQNYRNYARPLTEWVKSSSSKCIQFNKAKNVTVRW